jgi:translocation and assembly module TamA
MMNFFTIIIALLVAQCFAFDQAVCPQVTLLGQMSPEFSNEEKIFLCGDPAIEEWKTLPLEQVEFHARSLLKARGYHSPQILIDSPHSKLTMDPGPMTTVMEVRVEHSPLPGGIDRFRHILGQPLTAGILQTIEAEIRNQLRSKGYACPIIDVTGNPQSGLVTANVNAGMLATFGEIARDEIPGVNSKVIERYYPFNSNDPFDIRKLNLAQARTTSSNIVFSNSFLTGCTPERVSEIEHHFIAGGSKLVRVAIGANSEFGPITRAEWGNSRIGSNASQFNASGRFSLRDQRLLTWANIYFNPSIRWYLAPEFALQRFDEERLASFQIANQVGPKRTYDRGDFKFTLFTGPGTTYIQRLKGVGINQSFTTSLNFNVEAISHALELERSNPTSGTLIQFQSKSTIDGLLSQYNSSNLDISGIQFLNLLNYEPPLLVLSLRFRLATTITDESHNTPTSLPLNYRNYLGGSKDLRGYSRNEIPLSPEGGGSLLTWSTEARVEVPKIEKLYALGFWDFGYLGTRMASLDPTLYTSPGFGIYWVSPIGVLKGTLAHGVVNNEILESKIPTHWQFFLSFGENL